jgi:hypothetical protein
MAGTRKRKAPSENDDTGDDQKPAATTTATAASAASAAVSKEERKKQKEEKRRRVLLAKEKAKAWRDKRKVEKQQQGKTSSTSTASKKVAKSTKVAVAVGKKEGVEEEDKEQEASEQQSPTKPTRRSTFKSMIAGIDSKAAATTTASAIRKKASTRRSSTGGIIKASSSTKKSKSSRKSVAGHISNSMKILDEEGEEDEEEEESAPKAKRAKIERNNEDNGADVHMETSANNVQSQPVVPIATTATTLPPTNCGVVQPQLPFASPTANNQRYFQQPQQIYPNPFVSPQQFQQQQYQLQQLQQQQQQQQLYQQNTTSPFLLQPPQPQQLQPPSQTTTSVPPPHNIIVQEPVVDKQVNVEKQEIEGENELELELEIKEEEEPTKTKMTILSKIYKLALYSCSFVSAIFVVFTMLSYYTNQPLSSSSIINSNKNDVGSIDKSNQHPICFRNYGFESYETVIQEKIRTITPDDEDDLHKEEDDMEEVKFIKNENGFANCGAQGDKYHIQDCPQYGRCLDGKLVDCLSSSFEPSKDGTECVLSSMALDQMLSLHSKVVELTVEYTCSNIVSSGSSNVSYIMRPSDGEANDDDEELIMFDVNAIIKELNIDEETMRNMDNGTSKLVFHSTTTLDEEGNDTIKEWIGLSKEFIVNDLPLPTLCWVQLLSIDLAKILFNSFLNCLQVFGMMSWSLMKSYPKLAFGAGFVLFVVNWIRNRRRKVIVMKQEVRKFQDIVYDQLLLDCNGTEGCGELHLRDDIMHDMFANDCVGRTHFVDIVWPRVRNAVRKDNRVMKTRKSVGGKSLEWWTWVAGASRKARKQKEE